MSGPGGGSTALGLSTSEVRVLGCLLEKQRTTPDAYPLTLNALRTACNQSTNRDPVLHCDDTEVRDALRRLERRSFVRLASGPGSRAPKYRHLLAGTLPMSDGEQALMCVLMLRGAQTPGELKQRSERMHAFAGLDAVQQTLGALIERGLAARLDRRPGQKEERYRQLLSGDEGGETPSRVAPDGLGEDPTAPAIDRVDREGARPSPPAESAPDALAELTERVERLERELAELRTGMAAPAGSAGKW